KSDVQENQVGLQFLSLLNCLEPVRNLPYDLQFRRVGQRRTDKALKRQVIFHHEHADQGHEKTRLSPGGTKRFPCWKAEWNCFLLLWTSSSISQKSQSLNGGVRLA